jgi:hypothetical protein
VHDEREGQCAVIRSGIPRKTTSVGFSVTNVTRPAFVYKAADNHDPDGSSSGSVILVIKPERGAISNGRS